MFGVLTDFLWRVIDFLEKYNGAITALATVAISIFTFVLILVTRRQAILTKESVKISERALMGLERPYIFPIDPIFIRTGTEIIVDVSVANAGKITGTLIESNCVFYAENALPSVPEYGQPIAMDVTSIPVAMTSTTIDPRCRLGRFSTKNLNAKYFVGYFRYDGLIQKGHKTWFCYALPETGGGPSTIVGGPRYNGYN
jgi:hypothetical protein